MTSLCKRKSLCKVNDIPVLPWDHGRGPCLAAGQSCPASIVMDLFWRRAESVHVQNPCVRCVQNPCVRFIFFMASAMDNRMLMEVWTSLSSWSRAGLVALVASAMDNRMLMPWEIHDKFFHEDHGFEAHV